MNIDSDKYYIAVMSLISFITFINAIYLCIKASEKDARIFSLILALVSIWTFLNVLVRFDFQIDILTLLTKCMYLLGNVISFTFFIFCFNYSMNKFINKKILIIFFIYHLLLPFFYFNTNTIIGKYSIDTNGGYNWEQGSLWFLFFIPFLFFLLSSTHVIYMCNRKETNLQRQKTLNNLFILSILGFVPPLFFSVILPKLGYYSTDWVSVMIVPIWLIYIAHSTYRDEFFNIKLKIIDTTFYIIFIIYFVTVIQTKTLESLVLITIFLIVLLIMSHSLIKLAEINRRSRETIEKLIHVISNKINTDY